MPKKLFIVSSLVILLSVIFHSKLRTCLYYILPFASLGVGTKVTEDMFTTDELAQYNGVTEKDAIYLAILGEVYDVTEGRKHYEEGGPYHYFAGKDGSRAFVTGEFNNEGVNKDHILDLSCNEITGLINWRDTLNDKYKYKGKLIGRFYNEDGSLTTYTLELENKLKVCAEQKRKDDEFKQKFPPCNTEWSNEKGTRVWCSKSSGGIQRKWVGVPRQSYSAGDTRPNCVCVNLNNVNSGMQLRLQEYKNCPPAATECIISESALN